MAGQGTEGEPAACSVAIRGEVMGVQCNSGGRAMGTQCNSVRLWVHGTWKGSWALSMVMVGGIYEAWRLGRPWHGVMEPIGHAAPCHLDSHDLSILPA